MIPAVLAVLSNIYLLPAGRSAILAILARESRKGNVRTRGIFISRMFPDYNLSFKAITKLREREKETDREYFHTID